MSIRIALAGNPNCGKTTMFNDLTGSSQYVGNWPGVTVEKKEGRLKGKKDVVITDLPGIYSLSPYTLEEVVSRNYLMNEHPDAIINLVDGTNLERNLYLTTQILELGIPVVLALNMIDLVKKNGDQIDIKRLGETLGCKVVETSALKGTGSREAAAEAISLASSRKAAVPQHEFSKTVEEALAAIGAHLDGVIDDSHARWYAVKLFERDEKVLEAVKLPEGSKQSIEAIVAAVEKELDDDSESIITNERYEYIAKVMKACVRKKKKALTTSDKIDRIVTNRWLALPIFVAVMFVVYYVSVSSLGTIVTDFTNDTLFAEWIQPPVGEWLSSIGAADWLNGLIVDGIIGGVGAVLGFVPQMFILFFFLSILEDTGYMARVAFVMDQLLRKIGLSGRSIVPMLVGFGCSVPAIMSTRTLASERDRRMTILLTPFMSCSAKIPIYGVFSAAFFPNHAALVMIGLYILGILVGIVAAKVLGTTVYKGNPVPFVMELPNYRFPSAKSVWQLCWDKAKDFLTRAFTIIFVATIIVWFLQTFDTRLNLVDDSADSLLATVGAWIAPLFAPLGFADWRVSTALITGFIAKESVISTLGILTGSGADVSTAALGTLFTPVTAAGFLAFTLLYTPCVAAISAVKRELGSGWKAAGVALSQCVIAWMVAFLVYHIAALLLG